jgi:2-polyprenyl-3-methyl-5-hydroxy-6-metoxy-1,4-benzoquinol methylase
LRMEPVTPYGLEEKTIDWEQSMVGAKKGSRRESTASRSEIAKIVRELNESGGLYHQFDLGNGLVLDGHYDMTQYVQHYGLPETLAGKTALDVGTAAGFWADELARRDAKVTAIDVWGPESFEKVRKCTGTDVRYFQKDVYDLSSDFGTFDLVFCGSLLLHLSDVFRVIQNIRSVCAEEAIISTAIMSDPAVEHLPYAEFVGVHAEDGDYWTYWKPNVKAIEAMLIAAGFSKVEEISRFDLATVEVEHRPYFLAPHAVVRARV